MISVIPYYSDIFERVILIVKKILAFYLIVSLNNWCQAQSENQVPVLRDLQPQWMVYQDDKYQPYHNQLVNSIYFWIQPTNHQQSVLQIRSRHLFSLYINHQLVLQKKGDVQIPVDSLIRVFKTPLLASVYSEAGLHHLQTFITNQLPERDLELLKRKDSYFLDFCIIATIILVACFAIFLRTNPALTLDYLSVNKLFSFQDKDESKFTLRIASSVNLLIYLFGSFFLALTLLIAFRLAGNQFWLSQRFQVHSTSQALGQWFWLSSIIFLLFILKLLWLAILTTLFGFRDTVNFQFFNFIRMVLLAVSAIAFLCITFYMFKVQQSNYFEMLIYMLSGIFVAGTLITYFKLLSRMPFHFFHLFSYLCASEIIPLLVLMKVFFY
ncbi:MAG: DUF4271 domain-containing protein [Cyclobacteriaceae bacterium]|nr:DUF4271 domain-containing protein [Cyclobacteriaceae bacterium]